MKSYSRSGEPVIWNITEVPTKINEKEFILALRPNSPILSISKILIGSDIGLFEGDVILADGEEYNVTYTRGFSAIKPGYRPRPLYTFNNIEVKYNVYDNEDKKSNRKRFVWKYRDFCVSIHHFSGIYENNAIIVSMFDRLDPTELQQDAGFYINNERIFFGDLYEGCHVIMYYGRPAIYKDGTYYDIVHKTIIERKEEL